MYASLAIEGGIGAGKTTFATWLSKDLGAELMLERFEENPFLEKFYENPEAHAFSVELSFLADRHKQMQGALKSRNLFKQRLVADYSFAKSLIFAKVNLPKRGIQAVQHDVPNDGVRNFRSLRSSRFWIQVALDKKPKSSNAGVTTSKTSRRLFGPRGQGIRGTLQTSPGVTGAVGGHVSAGFCGTTRGIDGAARRDFDASQTRDSPPHGPSLTSPHVILEQRPH